MTFKILAYSGCTPVHCPGRHRHGAGGRRGFPGKRQGRRTRHTTLAWCSLKQKQLTLGGAGATCNKMNIVNTMKNKTKSCKICTCGFFMIWFYLTSWLDLHANFYCKTFMANKQRFHVFNDEKMFQEICFQLCVITIEDDCVLTNHVCLQKVKQPKANTKMNVPTNSSIRCYGGCAFFKLRCHVRRQKTWNCAGACLNTCGCASTILDTANCWGCEFVACNKYEIQCRLRDMSSR